MNFTHKDNQFTYFKYFFRILGFKMILVIILNILIGLLDGIGITMLFPLLQSMDGNSNVGQSMGQFKHVIIFLKDIGLPFTANVILIIFLSLFVLKACVKYLSTLYQVKVQLYFFKKIQLDFLRDFRQMSYPGFLKFDAGVIQNTLTSEIWRVTEAMRSYTRWSNSLFMLLTYVVLAFLANPGFAVLITIGVLLINIFYRKLYIKIKSDSFELSEKGGSQNAYLIELVHYFKYLKSTNTIRQFSGRLKNIIIQKRDIEYSLGKLSAIIVSIKEPTVVLIVVVVMLIQINYVGGGIGSIILSLLLFYRGLNYLMALQSEWQVFLRQSGGFRMVEEVTEKMKRNKEINGSLTFNTIQKEIHMDNISFSFGKNQILKNINISIRRNTTVAFTGVSGSGKSTLINMISGLLKPDDGKVVIDDINLNDYNLETYRSNIGFISQESVVFNDTIFNNISFWAEPTTENIKRFWEVAEMASLSEFIEAQENKENAPLGDNGILISGGQRQRISIARELFKNPKILVLDEATSSLDSETERVIQENIEKLHGKYTMIIIAHRLSTIKHVDEIFLLERGKVIHSGRFEDLIERSSHFKNLVMLQGL